jgi:hypothetical protein
MQSASGEQPVGDFSLVERFDNFARLRNTLRDLAAQRDEYAGIPMPLEGERLVIEPSYTYAAGLSQRFGKPDHHRHSEDGDDGWKERNSFWSGRKRGDVIIMEKDGKYDWGIVPGVHHFKFDLTTLGCSEAWGIEQEHIALQLLAQHVKHRAFKQYLLTGMFLETSKRSGVTYCFRKLRPTVAIKAQPDGEMKILAALCMHPIAHYSSSWAGAMCPTDDVIAHLMLMRADEHMYWRRSNQHPAFRPEAGL